MKKIYRSFFLLFIITLVSCQKILDTKPSDFQSPEYYYNTAAQLQLALNGVYDRLGNNDVYGVGLSYWLSTTNDETYQITNTRPENTYAYDGSLSYIENLWKQLYTGISRANLLLANINKPVMDETQRGTIKGEALFLRAYFYFLLVSNFGDVPLILDPANSVNDVNIARTPIKVVYDQITKDMIIAEGLLQKQTVTSLGYNEKVTKTAAEGILARVYLTMAGYPLNDVSKYNDVLIWAQKVVNSGEHALNPDYAQIFINLAQDKYDVKEDIWEVGFAGNGNSVYGQGSQAFGNYIGIPNSTVSAGYSSDKVRPTKLLFDSYEVNPASSTTPKASFDLRRDWNCANFSYAGDPPVQSAPITNTWSMNPGKWRRSLTLESPKGQNYAPINLPLLRYSDILLMIAEAENALHGPTDLAKNAINQVRRRAYGKLSIGQTVKTITVTSGGSGYSSSNLPTITLVTPSGSQGSGAVVATPTISGGKITSILISNGGSHYTAAPIVTITGGAGTGATATATITTDADADLPASSIGDKDAFLTAIKAERRREFFTECLRKADLIRWGNFIGDMKTMIDYGTANSAPTAFYTAYQNITPRYLLLPIPTREIGLNKLLTQNPGF